MLAIVCFGDLWVSFFQQLDLKNKIKHIGTINYTDSALMG